MTKTIISRQNKEHKLSMICESLFFYTNDSEEYPIVLNESGELVSDNSFGCDALFDYMMQMVYDEIKPDYVADSILYSVEQLKEIERNRTK